MCLTPITIKNKNYGVLTKPGTLYMKDIYHEYIEIPCGHCKECIAKKQMDLVQKIQVESITNYIYFASITYNERMIPKIKTSTGYVYRYANWEDLQTTFKRMRKEDPTGRNFRYIATSELGSKRGRPHFHILFLVEKRKGDDKYTAQNIERKLYQSLFRNWSRNVGTRKNPEYIQNFTYIGYYVNGRKRTNFDLHLVRPWQEKDGTMDVAFYVLKYMLKKGTKELARQRALRLNLPPEEYEDVWKKVQCKYTKSLDFGLQRKNTHKERRKHKTKEKDLYIPEQWDYVRKCIELSLENGEKYPCFYNMENGKSFPLARFYKNISGELFSVEEAEIFWRRANDMKDEGHGNVEPHKYTKSRVGEEKLNNYYKRVFDENIDLFDEMEEIKNKGKENLSEFSENLEYSKKEPLFAEEKRETPVSRAFYTDYQEGFIINPKEFETTYKSNQYEKEPIKNRKRSRKNK